MHHQLDFEDVAFATAAGLNDAAAAAAAEVAGAGGGADAAVVRHCCGDCCEWGAPLGRRRVPTAPLHGLVARVRPT